MAGQPSQMSGWGSPCSWCSWSRAPVLLGKDTPLWARGTGEAPASLDLMPQVPMALLHWHQTAQGRQERQALHYFIGKHGPVLVSDKMLVSLAMTDSINLNHLHTGLSQTFAPCGTAQGWLWVCPSALVFWLLIGVPGLGLVIFVLGQVQGSAVLCGAPSLLFPRCLEMYKHVFLLSMLGSGCLPVGPD